MSPRAWTLLAAVLLAAALLAVYANSFRVPFLFDDAPSIADNATLRSVRTAFLPPGDSGLTVSGRPLLNASLALNYALGALDVRGYHAVNLAIHFLAALTLFGLVRRTLTLPSLAPRSGSAAAPLALASALLWALHPLQTESVTYIIQRAESLLGLCYLLTLYSFVRACSPPTASRPWLLASVAACALGMVSKEVMVSAPLIVLLFDRTFVSGSFAAAWRTRRGFYLSLAATWLLLAACILSTGNRGGTVGITAAMSSWHYFLTQCYALTHYLRLALWPDALALDYGTALITTFSAVTVRFFALLALGLATLFALWKRPALGFLGAVFFAVLAPTSSFIPVITQTMAEHRMYLALAPVIILAVIALQPLLRQRTLAACLVLAVLLGFLTARRNQDYRDAFAIWEDTYAKVPRNVRALANLGVLHIERRNFPAALHVLDEALVLNPDDVSSLVAYGNLLVETARIQEGFGYYEKAIALKPDAHDAHYNYGKALLEHGQPAAAIAHLQTAVSLKPALADAHYNLGNALVAAGRPADALSAYTLAITHDAKSLDARNNFALALLSLGRVSDALPLLETAARLAPASAPTRLNQGRALMLAGRTDEGRAAFAETVRLDPAFAQAHANLASSLLQAGHAADALPHYEAAVKLGLDAAPLRIQYAQALTAAGRAADALPHYRRALELDPAAAEARYALANSLLRASRPAEAIPHYEALLQLAPNNPEVHNNLGIAFAQLSRLREARAQFEQALRLRPDFPDARENLTRVQANTR